MNIQLASPAKSLYKQEQADNLHTKSKQQQQSDWAGPSMAMRSPVNRPS